MAVNSFNAQNPPVTTKGDVFTFSTIPTRLGVGANDTVLTADSTTATGLKWAAVPSSNIDLAQVATGTLSGSSVTISSLSSYDFIVIRTYGITASANYLFYLRINGSSSSVYNYNSWNQSGSTQTGSSIETDNTEFSLTAETTAGSSDNNNDSITFLSNCKAAGMTTFEAQSRYRTSASVVWRETKKGIFRTEAAVSSIVLSPHTGTFSGGTYVIYAG